MDRRRQRPAFGDRTLALLGAIAGVVAEAAALGVATLAVASLEQSQLHVPDASPVYLVVVALVAVRFGTIHAVAAAIASFLLYDYLFVEPRLNLAVSSPSEWVNLLLLLFVAIVIGQLAARGTARAAEAERRAREAQALFGISRTLALGGTAQSAAPGILARLLLETRMRRLWLARLVGVREVVIADTNPAEPRPAGPLAITLTRNAGDEPARWIKAHRPGDEPSRPRTASADQVFRIRIESEATLLGWLVAVRPRDAGMPGRGETRLLALAADQLGIAMRRDELTSAATEAEVARRSDTLKTALLDSVSHDLRTPLASIRAAAGGLLDPEVPWTSTAGRAAAAAIDQEAQRLDRLVRGVLDLSRIEGGALHPTIEVYDVEDLIRPTLARLRGLLGDREVELRIAADLPFVAVDAVLFDAAIGNLVENVARHAPRAPLRIVAAPLKDPGTAPAVSVTVEDGGPGVPESALPRLFDKFYRVDRQGDGPRRGLGVGLAVVRGLVEAMGGRVDARRSELGGLAVRVIVVAAPPPPEETDG